MYPRVRSLSLSTAIGIFYVYRDLTFGLSRVDALSFVLCSLVFFLRTGELLADWSDSLSGTKVGDGDTIMLQ